MNNLREACRRWARVAIGIVVSTVCLAIFFRQFSFSDLADVLAEYQWSYLFLGIVSLAIGYALRIVRWYVTVRAGGADILLVDCVLPFLGSIALNNVLPLRAGDIVRAVLFPKFMSVSISVASGSLIVERLIDLMVLLICLSIGLVSLQSVGVPPELAKAAHTMAWFGGGGLLFGLLFARPIGQCLRDRADASTGAMSAIQRAISNLFRDFSLMSRLPILLLTSALSVGVWAFEAGLYLSILRGIGFDAGPIEALLVMAIATLSTLAPSTPGYVGPFHLAAFTAISLLNGTPDQAGAYALIVHFALWLPTTLAGALAILARPEIISASRPVAGDKKEQ